MMQQDCNSLYDQYGYATPCNTGGSMYNDAGTAVDPYFPQLQPVDIIQNTTGIEQSPDPLPIPSEDGTAAPTTAPNALDNLVAWVKANPATAAAIGGGLWFLFFTGDKKKRRRK